MQRPSVLWRSALAFLLPARCVGCGAHGSYLCEACLRDAPWLGPPLCSRCAEPGWEGRCDRCRRRPLALDGVVAPFLMAGVIRHAVHRLKYRDLRAVSPVLGAAMADAFRRTSPPADALVPVPLHPRQLRRRGYNQAALLAKEIGRRLEMPVWEEALRRPHLGPPQVSLGTREDRWANMTGAFVSARDLSGRALVLVDDVMTTGSTLHSAATALKAAGAASVWGLVLAREA